MSKKEKGKMRRGNGEGTIYHNGKYWTAQATVGYNPTTGKIIRKSFYGKTKKDVAKKLAALLNDLNKNNSRESSTMKVNEWASFWLVSFKRNSVSQSTYYKYESIIKTHIIKNLGDSELRELTTFNIQSVINMLSRSGLSDAYISSVYAKLNSMLDKAVEVELLEKNPCKAVVLPKTGRKRNITALNREEQLRLTKYCYGKLNAHIFIFQLGTGMRIGETLALSWDAISFKKEEIHITRCICETKGSPIIQDKTKTPSGARTLPMSAEIKALLCMLRSTQNHEKNALNLVFPSNTYTIQFSSNVRSQLARCCSAAGIRKINVHALRHTFATRAIEQNINIKVLSSLLGHKNTTITLNTYTHVLSDFKREDFLRIDIFNPHN